MMIVIEWTEKPWANWKDLIPSVWFEKEGTESGLAHICANGKDKIEARCKIEVKGKCATLFYDQENLAWNEEKDYDPGRLKLKFADATRSVVTSIGWAEPNSENYLKASAHWIPDFDYSVEEGGAALKTHIRRERDPLIVFLKKQNADLRCEACDFDFAAAYPGIGDGFCEVHHGNPLNEGARKTQLEDLHILCANCHRMIHRTKPMATVSDFRRKYFEKASIS